MARNVRHDETLSGCLCAHPCCTGGHGARTSDMMKLYLGCCAHIHAVQVGHESLHVRHDELPLPGCCAHIHAVTGGHGACTSDMMKLSLGVVHTSMLYRWTWGLHVRHG